MLPAVRLACPEGLEPPTYSLEGYCSIQLSYGQMDVVGCVVPTGLRSVRNCLAQGANHTRPDRCFWRCRRGDFAAGTVMRL